MLPRCWGFCIALDDGLARHGHGRHTVAVDEHIIARFLHIVIRTAHGEIMSPVNVNLIDLFFVRKADTVSDGIFFNDVKSASRFFSLFLESIETVDDKPLRQPHGSCVNRAGKRTAAGFIDTADGGIAF